jgi:hypothetical protein
MANIAAYNQLQNYANTNFHPEFARIGNIPQPQIQNPGESIPQEDGRVKYLTSMTPLQVKKALAISGLVVAVLASVGIMIAAILMRNDFIFLALLPTGIGVIGGVSLTIHYFNQLDLTSPKQRQEEIERIRSHTLTLSQINKRYGNFGHVVGYKLMGEAPQATYQRAALLSQQQAEADRIFAHHQAAIHTIYNRAIGPARAALANARDAEMMAGSTLLTTPRGYRLLPTLAAWGAARQTGYAEAELNNTIHQVEPTYQTAMQNLRRAYNEITQPIEPAFRQLALN